MAPNLVVVDDATARIRWIAAVNRYPTLSAKVLHVVARDSLAGVLGRVESLGETRISCLRREVVAQRVNVDLVDRLSTVEVDTYPIL